MSKITLQAVQHTASLARLDFSYGLSEEEGQAVLEKFTGQFEDILSSMQVLAEVDTTGVEPLYSPISHPAPPRADQAVPSPGPDKVLSNAPERHEDFFVVPAIL